MLNNIKKTILVVEDDDAIRGLAKSVLMRSNYDVLTASNGQEALDIYKLEKSKISLIILDLLMPVMDGKRCLKKLLETNPHIKVIITSGCVEGEDSDVIVDGVSYCLQKPYSIGNLLFLIDKILIDK